MKLFGRRYVDKKWSTKRTTVYLSFDPEHFALGVWFGATGGPMKVATSFSIAFFWLTFNLYVYPYDKNR